MITAHNLEDLIFSLFECGAAAQSNDNLKDEISESLQSLAEAQPSVLLTSAHAFLLKNTTLSAASRAFVLRTIRAVADKPTLLSSVDEQLLLLIINLATQEMTLAKDADVEWCEAARDVLVRISCVHKLAHFVLDALLQKFPPGLTVGPHRSVVATLGAVAQHNAVGFVPFLTDILSRAVPLLPHVKAERCVWSRALCAFCEAVRECEEASKTTTIEDEGGAEDGRSDSDEVHRSTYSDQAESTYDVVFGWLSSKDPKVRSEAANCVGELSTIVSRQKVSDDIKKLLTSLIALYKRATADQYYLITQGVCRLLETTCQDETCPLDAYLDDLLNALFPHACLDTDDPNMTPDANAIKNHSETFRCFTVAAVRFGDRIVYYLLHKMQHVQDAQKLGSINVLRHLLNHTESHLDDKRSLVMMGLRKLLSNEHNVISVRVSRAMVQLCVALADYNFIDVEGGEQVIAFLVRNLVAAPESEATAGRRPPDVDIAGMNQLRTQCAQALHTISATCTCASKLMWPYLFEFLCVERYTPVIADLSKCLRTLIQREQAEGRKPDYKTGFDNVKVAGKFAVLARLLVCQCNAPLNGLLARRARETLAFLRCSSTWFHSSAQVAEVIARKAEHLEVLIDELTGASTSSGTMVSPLSPQGEGAPSAPERRAARVARWHTTVLACVESVVSAVSEGDWRRELASALAKQFDLYAAAPEEKAFLMRVLGTVLSKIAQTTFITEHILLIFRSTNHSSAVERGGCAKGIGAIAKVHTDLVLVELENVAKWEHAKKSTGFFGFIKDAMPMRQYTDTEMVNLRATLMLAYGHLVHACPLDTVCQRLEQTIMVFLRHYMANQKQETIVRESLLETMHLMATAVHPLRLGTEYTFPLRNELLTYIKDYVQTETTETLSSALRLLACKAASALVRLEPPLNESDTWDLGSCLTTAVLPISREKSGLKTMEDDESATTMDATVAQYTAMLVSIVTATPTVPTVSLMLKMLLPYYSKSADHERSRAIDATVIVLRTYYEHARDIRLGTASDFTPLSSLLARLTPRLVDSLHSIRQQALVGLHHALRLAHAHKGHGLDAGGGGAFDVGLFTHEYLSDEGKMDGMTAKRAIKRFAEIVENRLPQSQMQTYISAIFEMLGDRQSQVSAAAAQLLTQILTDRGASLTAEATTLVTTLLSRLSEVHASCVQTYADVLAALVAFAVHQQMVVIDVLLKQPLPYSEQHTDAWGCVCRERSLFGPLLEYLLELSSTALDDPHDVVDIGGGTSVKVVHQELCAYIAALHEAIKSGDLEGAIPSERIAPILVTLLQYLTTVADTQFPVVTKEVKDGQRQPLLVTAELRRQCERPAGLAVSALRAILGRAGADAIVEEMNQARAWSECLDREHHINAIGTLARSLCDHRPTWIEPIVRGLQAKEDSAREPLRAAAVAVIAAIVSKCPGGSGEFNEELFDACVVSLQRALKDTHSLRIRKLSIRGMGELAECAAGSRSLKYASVCIDAAMEGLDDVGDKKDEVATESIVSLNKLVGRASDEQLKAILARVLLKVRPCFDKESPFLRRAAFQLFGLMAARVGEKNEPEFAHHLHANLVIVVLHLNEDDEGVRKACGSTLLQVTPLFTAHILAGITRANITEDGRIANFSVYCKDLAHSLVSSYPDKVNQYAVTATTYFKAPQSRVRCAAVQFLGHLLGALTPDLRSTIQRDQIFADIVQLLKNTEDVHAQMATAKAIANMHAYI